jgi:hypothetical protein
MSLLDAISLLNEVGLDKATLDKGLAESVEVREGVIAKAKEVERYWKSIAPVGDGREHLIYGELNKPGDYRDSIRTTYKETPEGLTAKVGSKSTIAIMVEYGNKNIEQYACRQRTLDAFGGGAVERA